MNLYELAFTCYIYDHFTSFNRTYKKFRELPGKKLDLYDSGHRQHLIDWLNDWGCRQFSLKHHNDASEQILSWYRGYKNDLPSEDKKLWELTELELDGISGIYDDLLVRKASQVSRKAQSIPKTVGPTGASKILFALRPEIAVPWDEAIRKGLKHGNNGSSYVDYLKRVCLEIQSLAHSCRNNNVELLDLPMLLDREGSTVAQLVGEYFWITETRKCYPPSPGIIKSWAGWLNRDASNNESRTELSEEKSSPVESSPISINFKPVKRKWPEVKCGEKQVQINATEYPLITHGKGYRFKAICDLDQETITFSYPSKSDGRQRRDDLFSFNEIFRICKYLQNHFEGRSFPLANNVEMLGNNTERSGLGMAIRTLPQTVSRAQAASYLGPYLEKIGTFKVIVPRPARWKLVVEPEMVIDLIKKYHAQA